MANATPLSAMLKNALQSSSWAQISTPENDLVEFQSSTLPANVQAQLVLGAIGGSELVKISRHNAVQGQQVLYQPIADMNANAADFQSKTIIDYVRTAKSMLGDFDLDLDEYFDLEMKDDFDKGVAGADNRPLPLSVSDDGRITATLDTTLEDYAGVVFEYRDEEDSELFPLFPAITRIVS